MTDILSLLEAATEGSRELDLALRKWNEANGGKESRAILHYTTNLQDAVSLVPEGTWYWHIRKHSSSGRQHDAIVTLRKPGEKADRCQFEADHRTPAMALCIAIIKASKADAPEPRPVCDCENPQGVDVAGVGHFSDECPIHGWIEP